MKYLASIFVLFVLGFSVYAQKQDRQDKIVGKSPGPRITLTTIDGKTINPADLQGKVVVYNLWYISCPPCREEIPELNKIVAEYEDKNVVFIALGTDSKASIEKYMKENPFEYKLVADAATIMLANFGDVDSSGSINIPFPTHVVVNPKGFIELKVRGKKGVIAVRDELERQFAGK